MSLVPKEKKPRKPNNHQVVIKNLVSTNFMDRHFWSREMKLASRLLTKYGIDFMLWLKPQYKKDTLLWYVAPEGEHFMTEQLFEYKKATTNLSPITEKIVESSEKVGEDVVVTFRPRTLKEFLEYGKSDKGRQEAGTSGGLERVEQESAPNPAG